jgi:predicted MFS family arabinose efflux permease
MNPARQAWTIVASLAVIGFVVAGAGTGVVGPVFGPMMQELGWSNGRTAGLATVYSLGTLASIPLVGIALDKWEARAVMAFGVSSVSLGLFSASHCHSWPTMLAAFLWVGIGTSASFYLPSAVVVANWMSTRKGLGMGMVMGAMSAGAALFSPLITSWTEIYGWRPTVRAIAALIALALPVVWWMVRMKPSNGPPERDAVPKARAVSASARSDLLSAFFALALAGGVLFSVGMQGIYFHVVALLVKAGYMARTAGLAFGCTWVLSGLGSLLLGVIADRIGAGRVLAIAFLGSAVGTLCLLEVGSAPFGIACVVAFVLLWGVAANGFAQLVPVVFAERFGAGNLGTLIGAEFAIAGVAGAGAPVITGMLYDQRGDYQLAIGFCAASSFVGFLLILAMDRRRSSTPEAALGSHRAQFRA